MIITKPLLPVFPAKAGIQIHPERLGGFTWAPAFAGETDERQAIRYPRMAR